MTKSGACHIIVVFMATCIAAASASGRATTSMFIRDDSIEIAGYGEEKLSTVIVSGTLLCASCSAHKHQLLPISGALVGATCHSHSPSKTGSKKPSWIKGITNKNGEFTIDMPSHLHAIPDLHKACSMTVLRLPKHSPCRSTKRRAHEIALSSAENGIRIYSAGTLHFLHNHFENPRECIKGSHGAY